MQNKEFVTISHIIFYELSEMWIKNKKNKVKLSTLRKYQYLLNNYIYPEIGHLLVEEINERLLFDKLLEIYYAKPSTLSPSIMKSIIYLLKSIFEYGERMEYCKTKKIYFELPESKYKETKVIENESEKVLVKYISENINDGCLGIAISLYTGLRIGEVCSLRKSDVDFAQKIIHVRTTVQRLKIDEKTQLVITSPKSVKSFRDIPIPEKLFRYLEKYEFDKLEPNIYLLGRKDIPYDPRTLQYSFKRIQRICQISDVKFHSLRHTYATKCIQSGMDIKTVSELLGHSNVAFTINRYVHSSIERKREQIKLLEVNLVI